MVVKMSASGRSFGGVADYCLHDRWVPGDPHPESAEVRSESRESLISGVTPAMISSVEPSRMRMRPFTPMS